MTNDEFEGEAKGLGVISNILVQIKGAGSKQGSRSIGKRSVTKAVSQSVAIATGIGDASVLTDIFFEEGVSEGAVGSVEPEFNQDNLAEKNHSSSVQFCGGCDCGYNPNNCGAGPFCRWQY